MRMRVLALVVLSLAALLPRGAVAETTEVRFARQFSMGYIALILIDKLKLMEKHGKEEGIELHCSLVTFNGPSAVNDALISGNVDIVAGGTPGLLGLWAKTRGTPQEVKGISGLNVIPSLLLTRNPAIKSIKDFTESDRIAVPTVRSSLQAVIIEMAAAKAWGDDSWARLDPLTLTLSPPDSSIGLMTGASSFNTVFAVIPYQYDLLKVPGVHQVLSSYDVTDGPSSFALAWTSSKWRAANPKAYKSVMAALDEATDIINKDPRSAVQAWLEGNNDKMPVETALSHVTQPGISYSLVPKQTIKFAEFLYRAGAIKAKAESWKDYFFPEAHGMPGS